MKWRLERKCVLIIRLPEGVQNTSDCTCKISKTAPYTLAIQYMEEKNNYNEGSEAITKYVKLIPQRGQPEASQTSKIDIDPRFCFQYARTMEGNSS